MMSQELQFEIKPIVIIDYLTTKLTGVDNDLLAHQVEVYKNKRLDDDENRSGYEDNELPNSKPINDFKQILTDALSQAVNDKIIIDRMWGHITVPQASTEYHYHVRLPLSGREAPFSCVYYCKIPEKCGDLSFRVQAGFREYIVMEEAELGKLIIFSSEIPHMTGKNASNENRISISANFRFA